MSITSALDAALSGLRTARRGLEITANNITNADTEGYVRKIAQQSPVVIDGEGRGVRMEEARRAADAFLTAELRRETGALRHAEALHEVLDRAHRLVVGTTGGNDLAGAVHDLLARLETLASEPASLAARTAALGALEDLVRRIGRAADGIQQLRAEVDRRIAEEVERLNGLLGSLHDLDAEIARAGSSPDLLDRRDLLLARIGEILDISTVEIDGERVTVFARPGPALLEYGRRVLRYEPATVVSATSVFGAIRVFDAADLDPATGEPRPGAVGDVLVGEGPDPDPTVGSGRLGALLALRDRELPALAGQLDELADLLRHTLNAAHNAATAVPPPARLAGTRADAASAWNGATRSGTAHVAVVDRASGEVVRTVAVDVSADFDTVRTSLAAGLGPDATVTVDADGRLSITAADGYGIAISEGDSSILWAEPRVDGTGPQHTWGFSHFLGLNDLLVAATDAPARLSIRRDIAADPAQIATARLDVDTSGPVPVAVFPGPGDGRGARALADALSAAAPVAGRRDLPARSTSVLDYVRDLTAVEAQRLSDLEQRVESQKILVEQLETRRAAISGVDLDEELSRLLVYQRAYAASARIVDVTRKLFDELLQMVR